MGGGEATVSPAEIAHFDALAARWWDPNGPMRALHRMNPTRCNWIAQHAAARFPQRTGLRLLDVGCGAGIAAEALAQRGFDVLGLDASTEAVAAARAHASGRKLQPSYRAGAPEVLHSEGLRFPIVTALEVIEHVPDPAIFVRILAELLEPGGLLFLSTLNRTARSFAAAKVGAEYLLRWLPVGTHDWRRFITPVELGGLVRAAGLQVLDVAGLTPDPLRGGWHISHNLAVNYLLVAEG